MPGGSDTIISLPSDYTFDSLAYKSTPFDAARSFRHSMCAVWTFANTNAGFADQALKGFASIAPADADVSAVADAIVKVVDTPFGERPFRVHIDPTQDGAEVVNAVSDRVRAELLRRIGLGDLLAPRVLTSQSQSAD